jgi:hypothetical protein
MAKAATKNSDSTANIGFAASCVSIHANEKN